MEIGFVLGVLLVGFLAGILSGSLGIGGGIVIIPALIYVFGFSVHLAQGTMLAMMVPPIGFPAFLSYYKRNMVNMKAVYILMVAFFIASYFGSEIALKLPEELIKKFFGSLVLLVGIKMLLNKKK